MSLAGVFSRLTDMGKGKKLTQQQKDLQKGLAQRDKFKKGMNMMMDD